MSCLWEGEPVTYCSNLLVTNEVGLIGGREPYGFPKLFGNVEWVKEHEIISRLRRAPGAASASAPACCARATSSRPRTWRARRW